MILIERMVGIDFSCRPYPNHVRDETHFIPECDTFEIKLTRLILAKSGTLTAENVSEGRDMFDSMVDNYEHQPAVESRQY